MKYQVHNNKMVDKKSKFILSLITIVFVFNIFFIVPNRAHAQFTDAAHIAVTSGKWIWDKLEKIAGLVKSQISAVTYKKVLGTFLNNLAYDAAVDLSEGAAGRKSKFYTGGWESYLTNAGDAAAGEFLVGLGDAANSTGVIPGLNVCSPKDPFTVTDIQLKLFGLKSGTKQTVKCDLSDMVKDWGSIGEQYYKDPLSLLSLNGTSLAKLGFSGSTGEEAKARVLRSILNPKQSDVAVYMSATEALEAAEQKAKELAEKKRVEDASAADGAKTPIDEITGAPKEPPSETKADVEKVTKKQSVALQYTGNVVADSLGVFIDTISNRMFGNLMSSIFKKLTTQNKPYDWNNIGNNLVDSQASNGSGVRDYIDQLYATIKTMTYNTNPTDIDLISELQMSLRDANAGIPGNLNDSVIDSDFAEALRRAQTGDPMTLKQAVDDGLINRGKIFGFTNLDDSLSLQQPNLDQGISYDNMKKLRKNRIIPVGWEMAALKIVNSTQQGKNVCPSSNGCTISDVLDQYSQFGTYKLNGNTVKDKYCGWRQISLEPYSLTSINHPAKCREDVISTVYNIDNVEVKWVGGMSLGSSAPLGKCYKYSFDEDGFLSDITVVGGVLSPITESECSNKELSETEYYEWLDGGCLIREKDESELCGLVNPDWILKAPNQKCFAKGYYSALEMNESSNRYQECADTRNCLKEDDYGKCIGGYGYCLKEKSIWRFKGDTCDKSYTGCVTLKDDENKEQSYIVDTLKDCPQEQVGCRNYFYVKSYNSANESYTWNETKQIYFNNTATKCDLKNQGCSNFIEIAPGANLIPNGGFEIDEGIANGEPDGWQFQSGWQNSLGGLREDGAHSGRRYFKYDNGTEPGLYFWMPVQISDAGLYTLSYYVRGSGEITANFKLNESRYITNSGLTFTGNTNGQWERKTGYLYITEDVAKNIASFNPHVIFSNLSGNVDIDSVQLELNSFSESNSYCTTNSNYFNCTGAGSASAYSEYGASSNIFLKKAPDYYGCQANPNKEECKNFSKYCSREDNGCELYGLSNGDPAISAVISNDDKCPSSCVGFQTYSQIPNYFDALEKNLSLVDKNFISNTAKDCSEPSCEEFTNIDLISQGGEGKEYYKELRQCVKPSEADTTIYYTWEGSDTSGFQLKTWKLLKSNLSAAPCVNVDIGGSSCVDKQQDMIATCNSNDNFDCRTFYDMSAQPYNKLSLKTIPVSEECISLRRQVTNTVYKALPSMSQKCSVSNVGCVEYKGNNGNNVKNVLKEEFESGTINPWVYGSNGSPSSLSGFYSAESLQYGGHSMAIEVIDSKSSKLMLAYNLSNSGIELIPGKQYTLSFWAKKYEITKPGDPQDTFNEDGTARINSKNNTSLNLTNKVFAANSADGDGSYNDGSDGDSYNDGSGDNGSIAMTEGSISFVSSSVINNKEWALYEYNIVVAPDNVAFSQDVFLKVYFNIVNNPREFRDGIYVDNIILKEFKNNFYKIKNSWNTPRACVDSDNNGSVDNKYLGCESYTKRDKSSESLYKFSDLCGSENVGCVAVIDTKNSSMPFEQTFNAYCNNPADGCTLGKNYYLNNKSANSANITSSTVSVAKDNIAYIVKDSKFQCDSDKKGCENVSTKDNEGKFQDIFLVNNPDNYITDDYYGTGGSQNLCLSQYQNCTAFSKSDGGYLFKIHPRDKTCEYKKADISSGIQAGFYKVSDGSPCDGFMYNKNYDNFVNHIGDALDNYKPLPDLGSEYAAICPKNQNSCTGFIDPKDNSDQVEYNKQLTGGSSVNVNLATQWKTASWNSSTGVVGSIANGDFANASDGIRFSTNSSGSVVLFVGTGSGAYNFGVNNNELYKLSASIKFESTTSTPGIWENHNRFISTFLICKKDKDSAVYYFDSNNKKLPYATPDLNSNYFVSENSGDNDGWKDVYGLYNLTGSANLCNIAFYVKGDDNAKIVIRGVKLEKVSGYYAYLDNESIDRKSCQSPSMEKGCVLFDQISDPTLKWNSAKSYENSNVALGTAEYPSDSNVLLKVTKDRTCGEWATCASSIAGIDESTGQEKNSCVSLVACDSLSSDNSSCDNYLLRDQNIKPLVIDDYQKQVGKYFSWSEMEYSGYSIPGIYPIDALGSIKVGEEYQLGRTVLKKNSSNQMFLYKFGVGIKPTDSYYNKDSYLSTQDKSCRLYPEKDSPFVWTQAISQGKVDGGIYVSESIDPKFQNANICQPNINDAGISSNNNCDCSYTKATYGASKNLYFSLGFNNIPSDIPDEYSTGTTQKKRLQTDFLGWRGFCLEKDDSFLATPNNSDNRYQKRCLSWYPVDLISGEQDSYSASPKADIAIAPNSKICLSTEDYNISEPRVYCAYYSSHENEAYAGLYGVDGNARCNVLAVVWPGPGQKVNAQYLNSSLDMQTLFQNNQYWKTTSSDGSSGIFVRNIAGINVNSSNSIIYGSNWPAWYEQNVYNSGFRCNFYNPYDYSILEQEKEIKFSDTEFGGFYSSKNMSGDLNLINDFKSTFSSVSFYFYDEGVQPDGSTYRGDRESVGVYSWDDFSATGFRADTLDRDKKDMFIPMANIKGGVSQQAWGSVWHGSSCGMADSEGTAYKLGCEDAITKYGTFPSKSGVPLAHEVYTNCIPRSSRLSLCGGSVSAIGDNNNTWAETIWNPEPYNYYVYKWNSEGEDYYMGFSTGGSVGNGCYSVESPNHPFGLSLFPYTMHGGYSGNPKLLQQCNSIGMLDGSNDSKDAVFHSDNYYINMLPVAQVSADKNIASVCLQAPSGTGGICSTVRSGLLDSYKQDRVLRVVDLANNTDNFNTAISVSPFSSTDKSENNLRGPILMSSSMNGSFDNSYSMGSYDLQAAKTNLANGIVKIPEIKKWTNDTNTWTISTDIADTWNFTNNTSVNAPIIKQVTATGEGNAGITINNSASGNISAAKNLKAEISFYAYAQWGRSPIDSISIDWNGNGSNVMSLSGPFKNRKANCERRCGSLYSEINWNGISDCDTSCADGQICFSKGWGDTPESCVEDKFKYSFIYVCTPDSPNWSSSCSEAKGEPCCKFNPVVTVTDSWGNSKVQGMSGGSIIITTK